MTRYNTAVTLSLIAVFALLSACSQDRFSDAGCESDSDCRGERVCQQGICVGEGAVEPDAADQDTSPDAMMQDIGNDDAIEAFLGDWELDSELRVLDQNGEVINGPENQTLQMTISESRDADLRLEIRELEGCNITADLRPQGTDFVVNPVDCEENPIGGAGATSVAEGSGALMPNEQLDMTLVLELNAEQQPGLIVIDIQSTGERLSR